MALVGLIAGDPEAVGVVTTETDLDATEATDLVDYLETVQRTARKEYAAATRDLLCRPQGLPETNEGIYDVLTALDEINNAIYAEQLALSNVKLPARLRLAMRKWMDTRLVFTHSETNHHRAWDNLNKDVRQETQRYCDESQSDK